MYTCRPRRGPDEPAVEDVFRVNDALELGARKVAEANGALNLEALRWSKVHVYALVSNAIVEVFVALYGSNLTGLNELAKDHRRLNALLAYSGVCADRYGRNARPLCACE